LNALAGLKVLGGLVLGQELTTLLVDEGLVPAWIEPLFDSWRR
jgi:hypothetical protein